MKKIIFIMYFVFCLVGPGSADQQMDRLMALPYLQGYYEPTDKKGVTIYDKALAYDGLNFYCSGHRPEAGIMDMEGNVLHRWRYSVEDIPGGKEARRPKLWRRAYLYDNGDILVVWERTGVVKFDKDSNVIWYTKNGAHHHMQVTDQGDIYVLTQRRRYGRGLIKNRRAFKDNYIVVLDSEGKFIKEFSIYDAIKNSSYDFLLDRAVRGADIFHTNTIQLLDGSLAHLSPLFKKGNALIAMRHLDTIAIIDLEKNQVVWAKDGKDGGLWRMPHEPVLLPNGRILLFDNLGGTKRFGRSRVLEYDLFKDEIMWVYEGNKDFLFETESCGMNQRLPNGNTLITDFERGRAFEITREGQIVWEWNSPFLVLKGKKYLSGTLFQVERIAPEKVNWLEK